MSPEPHLAQPASRQREHAEALEREADQAISVCGNDIHGALRAALVAISFLLEEIERLTRAVSSGFTRQQSPSRKASKMLPIVPEPAFATKRLEPEIAMPRGTFNPVISEAFTVAPEVVYTPTVPLLMLTTQILGTGDRDAGGIAT